MAIESQGAVITYDAVTIDGVTSISGPGGSASVIDISDLNSTAVEKLIGIADEGQVTLSCLYISADAGQVKCRTQRAARTSAEIVLTLSDASTLTFDAFCLGFSISGAVNQAMTLDVTLEVTGAVAFA
jgi:hypothetical protein